MGALVSVLVSAGVVGARSASLLEFLEFSAYDRFTQLRANTFVSKSPIVLIGITENDIVERLRRWPLSDETLAEVLETLTRYQPAAIGLDIIRDVPVPPGGERLARVLTRHTEIVVPMKYGENGMRGIPPPAALLGSDQVGFSDVLIDPGGVVRRGLLFLDDGQTTAYSFPLRLALLFLAERGIGLESDPDHPAHLRLGEVTIPPFEANDGSYVGADPRGYQFLIDYRDAPGTFTTYSLSDLLNSAIPPEDVQGNIILLGVTTESVKDHFVTPLVRGRGAEPLMPGIELHARIISQLLRTALESSSPIRTINDAWEILWILLWSSVGAAIGLRVRSLPRTILLAAANLLLLVMIGFAFFAGGWWIPIVPPAMAWLLSAATVTTLVATIEKQNRSVLMNLFARHVSPELAEIIWRDKDQFLHGGRPRSQKLTATILFSDVQGFTRVSENLDPETLMDWLNQYMEAMTPHVVDRNGVILRFIGDAIMAAFGVPIARTDNETIARDAVNALECALAMEAQLIALNRRWRDQQRPLVGMRIGIYTGEMVAGSLGTAQRLEYNVHGDAVNTAQRLESYRKDSFVPDPLENPCRIFVGEPTMRLVPDEYRIDYIGEVRVKGKQQRTKIFQLTGRR